LFLPVALLSSTRKNFSIMCSIITKKCKKSEQTDSLLHRILYCKKKKKVFNSPQKLYPVLYIVRFLHIFPTKFTDIIECMSK
jgi:hypothetical protein